MLHELQVNLYNVQPIVGLVSMFVLVQGYDQSILAEAWYFDDSFIHPDPLYIQSLLLWY